ncbi:MAG: T9SS type A sorting domain-containing protein [Bacteroidales bacterium]|nr:T9SS type A sorting domain-containing protein [Bacteroidales bacterium]
MKTILILLFNLFIAINIFAIDPPPQSLPANSSVDVNSKISLTISEQVSGAVYYDFQADTSSGFDSPALIEHTIDAGFWGKSFENLHFNKKYYWRVRSRNAIPDTSIWSVTWNFTVMNTITQSSPTNGATDQNPQTAVFINKRTGIDFYDYQIDTSANFNSPLLEEYSHDDTFSGKSLYDLRFGQKYYWRARGRHAVDTSEWTETWNFTIINTITQSSPTNGATNQNPQTAVYINKKTGIDFYDYQIDTSANFNSPLLEEYSHDDTFSGKSLYDLRFGQKYYWRARGRHAVDTSEWTETWNFTIINTITQSSPTNGATNQNPQTAVYINPKTGIDFYDYQVDTSANFNSPLLEEHSHDDTFSGKALYNLRFGQKYYWRARGRHAVDTTEWTEAWNFTVKETLTLASPNNGDDVWTGMFINWNSMVSVNSYQYQVDTVNTFDSDVLIEGQKDYINSSSSNADTEQYLSDTLFFGQTYYWRVRAIHDNDTCEWASRTFNTRDYVTLNTPTNESLNINTSGIGLDWNSHCGVAFYDLEFDKTNQFNSVDLQQISTVYINSSNINADTYHHTGILDENTIYFWRVRARNAVDTCAWTTRWFSTGNDPLYLPEIPILLSPANSAVNQPTDITFDWEDAANATEYFIEYADNPEFTASIQNTSAVSEYPVSGLTLDQTYYWRVYSSDGTNISEWSEIWSFTTGLEPLDAPVLVSPADGSTDQLTELTLDWNSVSGATSYEYQYSTDITFTTYENGTTSNTEILISSLDFGTQYFWRVQATDGSQFSEWSEIWNFTTETESLDAPVLISPSNGSTDQLTELTLDWNSVSGATSYEYQYSTDITFSTYESGTTSNTEVMISGLEYETEYFWRVQATDGSLFSEWSEVWSFTTETESLDAPALISPVNGAVNQLTELTLDWNSVTEATSYEYQYSTDIAFSTYESGTTSNTEVIISELEYETEYFWRVQATDGIQFSEWSEVWSFTTETESLDAPVLISPVNGAVNQLIELTLDWNSVSEATSYEYQYSTDIAFSTYENGTTSNTEVMISGLEYETEYFWRVQATDGSLFSEWSEVWSFTTEPEIFVNSITEKDIKIFPNPVNGLLYINSSLNIKGVSVYNITGKKMFEENIIKCNYILNTSDYPEGVYIINLIFENKQISKKLIVKH